MKDWPKVTLGECLSDSPNYGANAPSVPYSEELPRFIRITDIGADGNLLSDDKKSLPREAAKGSILDVDDIVFARTGATVGKTYLHTETKQECAFAGYLIRFKIDKTRLLPKFLSLYTQSAEYDKWLTVMSRAGAQPNINAGEYCSLTIPLPSLPEQKAIVQVLRSWDEAIAGLSALIEKKLHLKRALMQRLLTGAVRFGEFVGQQWRRVAISEVLQLTGRLVTWNNAATYNLASVRRNSGGLFWREALKGSAIKVKKLHTIQEGDFLISHIQAAYGATGRVPKEFAGGHVSDMYSILTAKPGFDVRFMDLLSQMPLMQQLILLSSNGFFAERLRLNFDPLVFMKQQIYIPPTLAEQQKIPAVLDAADAEISLLRQELAHLKEQKRGLMQRLLSGRVRVPAHMIQNGGPLLDGAGPGVPLYLDVAPIETATI